MNLLYREKSVISKERSGELGTEFKFRIGYCMCEMHY